MPEHFVTQMLHGYWKKILQSAAVDDQRSPSELASPPPPPPTPTTELQHESVRRGEPLLTRRYDAVVTPGRPGREMIAAWHRETKTEPSD
ncbi:hypothetical protein E3U43_012829 [Larimichthys crocea]|uniref:Uncharacterized protein n=1 Tax=Larimichthys crocea TaxID=215358 RepID=A0ACD3RV30_LARCR|nr:hypothetical protein E3U43_012829 [Larimichthys crocea]